MGILEPVTARWKEVGLALRLKRNQLDVIEKERRGQMDECLTEVLTLWLNRVYDTEQYGEPSWKLLANAVGHPVGGKDSELSREIASKHIGRGI